MLIDDRKKSIKNFLKRDRNQMWKNIAIIIFSAMVFIIFCVGIFLRRSSPSVVDAWEIIFWVLTGVAIVFVILYIIIAIVKHYVGDYRNARISIQQLEKLSSENKLNKDYKLCRRCYHPYDFQEYDICPFCRKSRNYKKREKDLKENSKDRVDKRTKEYRYSTYKKVDKDDSTNIDIDAKDI